MTCITIPERGVDQLDLTRYELLHERSNFGGAVGTVSNGAAATSRRVVVGLWVGFGAFVAGRVLDWRWHATHDEFEGPAEQLQAHWLAWLGAVILLVAAVISVREGGRAPNVGTVAVLVGAVAYVVFAAWHFYEHAQDRDPEALHLLLVAAQLIMLGGVLAALLLPRRAGAARSGREP